MIVAPDADGKYHIAICIPTHESVPYQFAIALANMLGYTIHAIGDQVNITTHVVAGTYIHRARQQLLDEISETGAHYILWLDTDHTFPKDLMIRLLSHDVEMVGINYCTRGVPPRYVAVKRTACENRDKGGGKLCPTREDSEGLEEVEAIGFGAVLMKMSIIPTLPQDDTLDFFFAYEGDGMHVGEDVYFCKRVREAGWKVMIDHDLSKLCTHVGQIEYRLNHVWAMEEEGINVDYELQQPADGDSELGEPERSDESDS